MNTVPVCSRRKGHSGEKITACQSVGDGQVGSMEGRTDGLTFKHQPTTCEERGTGRENGGDKVCGIAGSKDILKNPLCWLQEGKTDGWKEQEPSGHEWSEL